MKKRIQSLSPETKQTILTVLYFVIFALMMYKIVTAKTIYEMILFAVPAVYCVYATFGESSKARYRQVNDFVYKLCQPAAALNYMEKYPAIAKTKKWASNMKLLRAYALIDSGQYAEATRYITEDEKGAFSADNTKAVAEYLLFNIAFLNGKKRETASAFARLNEYKESFTTDMLREQPSHVWYLCEGNYNIVMEKFDEARALYEKADTVLLVHNRDKAYYHYSMSMIAKGLGDKECAAQNAALAKELGPGIDIIEKLK